MRPIRVIIPEGGFSVIVFAIHFFDLFTFLFDPSFRQSRGKKLMFDQQGVERTYKVQYAKKTSNRRDEYQMLFNAELY